MALSKLYGLLHWEDNYVNVVELTNILWPRRDPEEYNEGQYIRVGYKNSKTQIFGAVISEISGKFDFRYFIEHL